MSKTYLRLILFLLLCLPTIVHAQVKNEGIPFIRNYTQRDYKASPQNWAVVQDHRGIMYVGNNFGVLEFDGNFWRQISLANRTSVRSLAVDKSGRVYVGGQGDFGYLQPDGQGLMAFTSLLPKVAPKHRDFDDVWKIYASDEGIFYCTVTGIYHLQADTIRFYETPVTPSAFPVWVHKKLYVPVPQKGIYELKNRKFVMIPGSESMADYVIVAMLPHSDGKTLILTEENGVFAYNGYSGFEKENWPVSDFLVKNKVYAATALGEAYAIGTAHDGLLIVDRDGNPRQHLNREKGLQNSNVRSIYQDHSGNLWLALNNGIDYIETNSAFTLLNIKNGLSGTGYTSLLDGEELYLGTNDGLFHKTWSNTENPLKPEPFRQVENTQGQVYNIQRIGDKLLLAHHNGPYELVQHKARKLSDHRGAWLFLPLATKPGYILCGTYTGLLLYKLVDGRLEFQNRIQGFDESSRVVEEDADGNIWVAHGYKGIYKLALTDDLKRVKQLSFYGQKAGLPSNLFNNVFKIDGKLVFSGERGVYAFDKRRDRFVAHDELSKLFGKQQHVRKLIEDSEGSVWFSAGDEVGVLRRRSNGSYEVDKTNFSKLQGKLIPGFEHIMHYNALNVLIGIDEGFVHYHPSYTQVKNLTKPFQALIRQVNSTRHSQDSLLSGGTYTRQGVVQLRQPANSRPELPYKHNSLRFSFGAIAYEDIDRVQYQYLLEGHDEGWSSWSEALHKEYTDLHEGNYTFRVRARSIYNRVSEEATYTFEVLPPWYRSVWAYTAYAILGVLLILLLRKLFINHVRATEAKLKEEKDKALKLKEAQHKEEVLLAEREIIRLNTEKLETELEHKNKELTSSAVHVMQNMQAVHKMRDQLLETMEAVKCKETQKQLKKLMKSVEEEIKLEDNWDQFELHFNQVHEDFLRRLSEEYPELTHRDLKLCAYLRLNLTSKEIASLLKLSLRGVETSRYRLRKKMNLEQEENLTEFILKY